MEVSGEVGKASQALPENAFWSVLAATKSLTELLPKGVFVDPQSTSV